MTNRVGASLVIGVVGLLARLLLVSGGGILAVLTVIAYLSAGSPANLGDLAPLSLLATLLCFATGVVLLFIGYKCFRTRAG
jgi:hypothetical protein